MSTRKLVRAGEPSSSSTRRESVRQAGNDSSQRRQSTASQHVEDNGDGEDDEPEDKLSTVLPKVRNEDQIPDEPWELERANPKIKPLTVQWSQVVKTITSSMGLLNQTAVALAEAMHAEGAEDVLNSPDIVEADKQYRGLLDQLFDANARKEALEDLRHRLQIGEKLTAGEKMYTDAVEAAIEEYSAKTARAKYVENSDYLSFRTELYEACHDKGGMPPLKKFIEREEGDPESDDEEIEMQGGSESLKDPITMTWLEKPVRHDACKHTYSRDSITAYIRNAHQTQIQCPVAGCNKMVVLAALKDDEALERRVQAKKRREEERHNRQAGDYAEIEDDDD